MGLKEHQFISFVEKETKSLFLTFIYFFHSGDIMKDKDLLVDRVSKKTNVKKEDIFKLANDLQKKDLNNEKDMRDFIQTVAKVTNQSLDQRKIDKLIKIMQNKDVLNDVEKMI